MPDLKEVFNRINVTKQEKRKLNESYREALEQNKPYQDIVEQLKAIKTKKLQFETTIREDFTQEMEKMERLAEGIQTDMQMLSDMALTMIMKGETIEIKDENDVTYEPVFKVTYKKTV